MISSVDNTVGVDVVVIGGGLSGLTSSCEIKKRDPDLRVVVLEAKDRLGGRTLSLPLKTATGEDVWDLGGQWVSSAHKNILEVISELNLETYPQYCSGKKLIHLSNGPIKSYSGAIPNLSFLVLLDLEYNIRKMNKLCQGFSRRNISSHPDAEYYDSMTVEMLCNKQMWTDAAVRILKLAVETLFGVSPSQLSALFFLTFTSSAGGIDKLIETSKGCGQELKVKGGTQQISTLLAEKFGMENVHLSEPVTAIKEMDGLVEVCTANGNKFTAKKVILAIPAHLNAHIEFTPPLPTCKSYLFKNLTVGNLVKIIVVYEKAFWRENGFSGEVLNEGCHEEKCEPIDIVFDATSANGSPALVAFMSASRGIVWADVEADERQESVLKCLSKFFGEKALTPVSYTEKNWYFEPYTGGCPISLCPTGMLQFYPSLSTPHGSIHWAGTEIASEWAGYMEGAISSGKQAAVEVLLKLRPDLLTPEEKSSVQRGNPQRRKSQVLRQRHKVFRYAVAGAVLAIGIVTLKKMYFRIAI